MDDLRDLDEDLLNLLLAMLLAAMGDICKARPLDIAKVRNAVAAQKAPIKASNVGGRTNPGETGEEAKRDSDMSIAEPANRGAHTEDSRGGLRGVSNFGREASSAGGSGFPRGRPPSPNGIRDGHVFAQLQAENARMRALIEVRAPRAMWRVGTCLSMRVGPIPHVFRRSLRIVTRAMVPAQDVDMYSSRPSCDKQKRSTFQNRAYDLSTRLWGR